MSFEIKVVRRGRPYPPLYDAESFNTWCLHTILDKDITSDQDFNLFRTTGPLMCYFMKSMKGSDSKMVQLLLDASMRLMEIFEEQESKLPTDYVNPQCATMKRKFQRLTKALMHLVRYEREEVFSSSCWMDIYRTVGGNGTMETDESIFEIPHVTTIFQTNDAFDTNKLLSTLFVSLFSETKRRGFGINASCWASIENCLLQLGSDPCDVQEIIEELDSELCEIDFSSNHGCKRKCQETYRKATVFEVVGNKNVKLLFVRNGRKDWYHTSQDMEMREVTDVFKYDKVFAVISCSYSDNFLDEFTTRWVEGDVSEASKTLKDLCPLYSSDADVILPLSTTVIFENKEMLIEKVESSFFWFDASSAQQYTTRGNDIIYTLLHGEELVKCKPEELTFTGFSKLQQVLILTPGHRMYGRPATVIGSDGKDVILKVGGGDTIIVDGSTILAQERRI
jgi:hypothetical protein